MTYPILAKLYTPKDVRGIQFHIMEMPHVKLAFSYETCVGFQAITVRTIGGRDMETWSEWRVMENAWGPTTGGHMHYLNYDKTARLPAGIFREQLEMAIMGNYYHLDKIGRMVLEELEAK